MAQRIASILRARRALTKAAGLRVQRRKVPKLQAPTGARLRYQTLLTAMRKTVDRLLREELLPALPGFVEKAARERGGLRTDATVEELQAFFARLRLLFVQVHPQAETAITLQDVATETDRVQALGHQKQMKAALGVELIVPEPWRQPVIADFIAENQGLVTSLVDGELEVFRKITGSGIRSGLRVEEIARQLTERLEVTESKAALLARDQTLKLFGEMTELRQRNVGIEEYVWNTSGDERVRGRPDGKYPNSRPSHWALEGKICRWDDPTVYRDPGSDVWKSRASIGAVEKHPGQDYQDRCQALPVLPEDYLT